MVNLPKLAPIITSKNVTKHQMIDRMIDDYPKDDYAKCCLLGHIRYNLLDHKRLFKRDHGLRSDAAEKINTVQAAIQKVIKDELKLNYSIVDFNDNYATQSLIAKVWNRAMSRLGYTEGNPQNKPLTVADRVCRKLYS